MAKPFTALRDPRLGLDDVLTYPRYKGCTVKEVLADNPGYISWLMSNTGLKFYPSVHEMLLLMKPKRVPQHTSFSSHGYYSDKEKNYIFPKLRDESHNIFSDQDDWFDDVPF